MLYGLTSQPLAAVVAIGGNARGLADAGASERYPGRMRCECC